VTTIAYRDGVLAADTLITAGGIRCGSEIKVKRLGRLLYGSCGSCGLTDKVEGWIRAGMKGDRPPLKVGEATGSVYVFMPDERIVWMHEDGDTVLTAPYWAAGSGEKFALGAMAYGASAEEAVKAAIMHDTGSGGAVTVLRRQA
jgi:hypothetical protein